MKGDFNIYVNEPTKSDVSSFMTILSSFGLRQHVQDATHRSGHILDLILTRFDENLIRLCDVSTDYGSDHSMIRCVLQQRKPPPVKVVLSVRDFSTQM